MIRSKLIYTLAVLMVFLVAVIIATSERHGDPVSYAVGIG